jgi:chromosome segregation ATPase
MALTSTEIKRLLQPMADFAPAILRCAEIVEAAEKAEHTISESANVIAQLTDELVSLGAQRDQLNAEVAAVAHQVADKKREARAEMEALDISIQIVKDQLSASQRDFETAEREQQEHLYALTVETQVKADQLKERTSALAAFMAQFPAVK